MIAASVGVGLGTDAYRAGVDACAEALSGLSLHKPEVLFVFASVALDQDKLIEGISKSSPGTLIVGCSTAGEISSDGFSLEKSVVVMAIASDKIKFWGAVGNHIIWNSKQAGQELANTLEYDSHGYMTSALLFLDIISGNGEMALNGMLERLGQNFPVYGGSAADDMLFFQTYQYLGDKVYNGSAVGVGISGEYHAAGVARHGFLPIGISRRVTRSEGTTLLELDGKPAVTIYEDYFGEEHLNELHEGLLPALAVSYPLGVFLPESNHVILRNPVFVDQKGGMTFTSTIPEGSEVRLMISDIERGLEVAVETAKEAVAKLEGRKPKAAIIINSVARKKMFGGMADEEIQVIQQVIGRDVPIAGYYSYAQIGDKLGGQVPFHNGSLLIWLLAE
jgi:hypothetical protein